MQPLVRTYLRVFVRTPIAAPPCKHRIPHVPDFTRENSHALCLFVQADIIGAVFATADTTGANVRR